MTERELFTNSKEFLQLVVRLRMIDPEYRRFAIDAAALWCNEELIERMHRAKMCGDELNKLSPEEFSKRLSRAVAEMRGTETLQ